MDPSSYTHTTPLPPPKSPSPFRPPRSSHSQHHSPRLGAIPEDGSAPILPDLPPPRAHNRPLTRMFHLGFPPLYGAHGEKTPEYGEAFHNFDDVKGPKGEDFGDLRHNRHVTKRGGWRRLVVIAVVVLAVLVGVGVGLGVGLAKKRGESSADSPPSSGGGDTPPQNQTFPLGSYTFPTYLAATSTSCSPNPETWTCFPYTTTTTNTTSPPSPSTLPTLFYWIITPSSSSSSSPPSSNLPTYQISSSANPFALTFSNETLTTTTTTTTTTDAGSNDDNDDAALTFSLRMQKLVVPATDISGDGSAARCLYNDTLFAVTLYIRRPKTYPATAAAAAGGPGGDNSTDGGGGAAAAGGSGGGGFRDWPFAVEIRQTSGAGPDCYRTVNGQLGARIGLVGGSGGGGGGGGGGGECGCSYLNFGT